MLLEMQSGWAAAKSGGGGSIGTLDFGAAAGEPPLTLQLSPVAYTNEYRDIETAPAAAAASSSSASSTDAVAQLSAAQLSVAQLSVAIPKPPADIKPIRRRRSEDVPADEKRTKKKARPTVHKRGQCIGYVLFHRSRVCSRRWVGSDF